MLGARYAAIIIQARENVLILNTKQKFATTRI